MLIILEQWSDPDSSQQNSSQGLLSALDRYAAIAGIILWASQEGRGLAKKLTDKSLAAKIKKGKSAIAKSLTSIFNEILADAPEKKSPSLVYQISLNRKVKMAVARSVPAVKADAARTLFKVDCSQIAWGVIDAGIQGDHHAFQVGAKGSRVKASFDFSNFRRIVSLDNLRIFSPTSSEKKAKAERLEILLHDDLKNKPSKQEAGEFLTNLAADVKFKRPIHWEFVEPFIEIKTNTRPAASDHGTHVAGIIGADKEGARHLPDDERLEYADGMCPNIQLYDFRVLADSDPENQIKDTEFAVISALQYIRHLNERHDYITIHGANLSLSIPHDVRNYACGRTPVCIECERLVDSGVIVVAAAGNFIYTNESFSNYSADPSVSKGMVSVLIGCLRGTARSFLASPSTLLRFAYCVDENLMIECDRFGADPFILRCGPRQPDR